MAGISKSFKIEEQIQQGLRLDRFVSENMGLLSRSQIKARNLKAKINGKDVKLSRIVKQGDYLDLNWDIAQPEYITPEDIPLDIVWEDERCIVVNKAQGMVVHPAAGNRRGTLANALYFIMLNKYPGQKDNCDYKINMRPGIVHRLDKETSGIIISALDDEAHAFLSQQFKDRKVKKNYLAIICGTPKERTGRIETCITRDIRNRKRFTAAPQGKQAISYYKVLKSWSYYSLVMLRPRTGRTHQLRVHMKHIGHPILGDPVYGCNDKNFPNASLMLHSKSLVITLPGEKNERAFSSSIPERFTAVIEKLEKKEGAYG